MRAPEDGIRASKRNRGWLAESWKRLLGQLGNGNASRLARGRTFARSGRVRDLWFSPGLASAEVVGSGESSVVVRVRTFDEQEWLTVREALLSDLSQVAALLEGRLPERVVAELARKGCELVPSPEEIDGDCDCDDFLLPCEHMAAVHHVLADALDGEPFLLLTLRGRTREQLMAELLRSWGDPEPLLPVAEHPDDAPPPPDGWYDAPSPLPARNFSFRRSSIPAAGLRALGPPPGDAELLRALEPLYDAGACAALEIATGQPVEPRQRTATPDRPVRPRVPAQESFMPEAEETDLTERLVNALAAHTKGAKSNDLADELNIDKLEVRHELISLEKLGVVYRTGQTRGTRWWLG